MYLMNVPPVAAIHPEWRSCGPPRGYSLPLCFHDSDSELSTTGTPIPEKVQMIIESLRSTQSSLDMGDEIEGNVLSGQEAHPQVCKARTDPVVVPKSKSKGPTECRQPNVSSPINSECQNSDSDDSVDRGIEEAILEYLKERDNHKRKAEPATNILQPCKIPRKDPPVPEISEQHSDSNKMLTASIQVPKSVKVENHTAPAFPATSNLPKGKPPFKENPVKKTDSSKGTTTKSIISLDSQKKCSQKTNALLNKIKCPVAVKAEEDSSESSSDDGIEEAIQRYQLEKKEEKQKGSGEALKPLTIKEEPDSSSDDGIEEAIRSYQLEQLKEKSVLKPSLPKQKPIRKLPVRPIESTSTGHVNKLQLSRKKKKITEKEVTSLPAPPSPVCTLKSGLPDSPKGQGNGVLSSKVEIFREQQTLATLKVNTTAELMCAEAILDISKAVMPEVFNPNVGLVSSSPAQPSSALVPSSCPHDKSDDSSIDSEDGIEQEILKFLEQKAQIQKQPPDTAATTTAPRSVNTLDKVKSKQTVSQKKALRLSLTQKRRQREEDCKQISKEPVTDHKMKEDAPLKLLPEHEKGSSPSVSPLRIPPQPSAGLDKTEQSGDKSSSLDSDEDLDTAIKDLLKTKKKSKKKMRDMKLKSRKCLKDAETLSGNTFQAKKLKPDPISKGSVSQKVKSRDDITEKSKLIKSVAQHKQSNKRKEPSIKASESDKSKGHGGVNTPSLDNSRAVVQIKEDSSSVDSDDSIEQEIRKFLAEKAKVSTTEKTGAVPGNANVEVCNPIPDKDIELENQLAEIPRKDISPLPDRSLAAGPDSKPSRDKEASPTTHTALPDTPKTVSLPCLSSVLSNSPSPPEPADGAGAVRAEKKRSSTGSSDYQNVTSEMVKARPLMSPSVSQSRFDSIKWRQSLGLPITEARGASLSRNPFRISSPIISETASTTPAHQRGSTDPKPQTPATACPSARSSRSLAPFQRSPEGPALSRSPYFTLLSIARQPPERYFMQGLAAGAHWAQHPMPERTESVVHMAKDQCAFVELASNKINHVQVRSKEMSEGKDRRDLPSEKERERESMKTDEKGMELGREEEDCVDETDCESNERRSPEKKQGFSTL